MQMAEKCLYSFILDLSCNPLRKIAFMEIENVANVYKFGLDVLCLKKYFQTSLGQFLFLHVILHMFSQPFCIFKLKNFKTTTSLIS